MAPLHPGELWQRLVQVESAARAGGHLYAVPTDCQLVEDQGITFLVRLLAQIARKPQPSPDQPTGNPFLPPDPQLFVGDLGDSHRLVLNKYMVVEHHLLLVTRAFQRQTDPLQPADFAALAACLCEYPSVAFYNSGRVAGASQSHCHLQLVPQPLDPRLAQIPIEAGLPLDTAESRRVLQAERLPFVHRWWRFDERVEQSPAALGSACQNAYQALIDSLGWERASDETPYNLQVTRRWMMLVPRHQECFAGASLNGLAFLGALLVRDETQLRQLLAAGPMAALQAVAFA